MQVKAALSAVTAVFLVAACEPESSPSEVSAEQGITEADPLGGLGGMFISYAMTMYDTIKKISQIYEPTLSTQDLFDMRSRIGTLESDVVTLRDEAKRLAAFVDAFAAETRARAVGDAYAALKTGLDIVADQSSRAQDGSEMALLGANTLNQDLYYLFTAFGGGNRFDPRMATPTFEAAVTTWLGMRERGSIPMSASTDDLLRTFASRMDWIVAQSRAAVSCTAVREEDTTPCPDNRCEKKVCDTYTECSDSVMGETTRFNATQVSGSCPTQYRVPAPDKEAALEQGRYAADANQALANAWRSYADLPNTNLALNRPAFQWPEAGFASAQNAVDGNTDGNFWAGSVTHTDEATGTWWWVDLGSVQHIREIRLFNRTDCCSSRLSHYQVQISPDSTDGWDGTWAPVVDMSWLEVGDGDNTPRVHPVDTWARWVAVTKTDLGYLSLAEVQVMTD